MKRRAITYCGGVFDGGEPLGPMTVREYFRTPETNQREELVYGWMVRDEPNSYHQETVGKLIIALDAYVRAHHLGKVYPSVDVVLDERKKLVLAPDVLVIFNDRLHYIRERLWGPPTIAIEVLSRSTKKRDRQLKLQCYRKYGVEEYWMVDVGQKQIEVVDFSESSKAIRSFRDTERLRSKLLPRFRPQVTRLISDRC